MTDFDTARDFVQIVAAARLPLPDQMDCTPIEIVLRWSASGLEVHLDRDRDDFGPIDELEAAMMKGLSPDEWPYPTVEGYADYLPPADK